MGKLALLLVLASVLGGTVVTMSMRSSVGASAALVGGAEADVVAREIAETARNLAVSKMLGAEGFVDPLLTGVRPLDGGEYTVSVESLGQYEATLRVVASYGGAVHTTRSTYLYDPMNVPGPIWVDAPVATGEIVAGARPKIWGGADGPEHRNVVLDRRGHDKHELESFFRLDSLTAKLGGMAGGSGLALEVPPASAWEGESGLLGNLGRDVRNTEDLYFKALAQFEPGSDVRIGGPKLVTGAETWAGPGRDRITVVTGDLLIAPGGRVEGSGVLVVNGALRVTKAPTGLGQGSLTWRGLVIVRSSADELPVELKGAVSIQGALAVAHTAFPPGGHLDVSVYADLAGMDPSRPGGAYRGSRWPARHPWFNHSHAFDLRPHPTVLGEVRGPHVVYLKNGNPGPYEAEVDFALFRHYMPNEDVYVEFGNPGNHGYATFRMEVAGQPVAIEGTPQEFPLFFRHRLGPTRSAPFRPSALRSLEVKVQSLRALRKSFDHADPGCDSYPECIGNDWNRKGALSLRIMRARDHKRLYESTLYWHMREDEVAAHEAAENAWRERIRSQTGYGAHITLGNDVDIQFRHNDLDALVSKMGFVPDNVRLVTASADHLSATDPRVICEGASTSALGAAGLDALTERLRAGGTLGACRD